jgi:transcriptional regulator with XRE-family HTH domain
MSTIPQPPPVGERLRALRTKRRLSLDDLARRSGVSKSMLSQIESNKANPTVGLVWKIARALGVDLMDVIGGENQHARFDLTTRGSAPVLADDQGGYTIQILSPIEMVETLELYWLKLKPGAVLESHPHVAQTEEFATVLKGRVEIASTDESATLRVGDTLRYHADCEHVIRNKSRGTSEVYLVVRYV